MRLNVQPILSFRYPYIWSGQSLSYEEHWATDMELADSAWRRLRRKEFKWGLQVLTRSTHIPSLTCSHYTHFATRRHIIYTVSQKTSPTFLAVTQESIVGFS